MRFPLLTALLVCLSCVLTAQNTYHPLLAVNTTQQWLRSPAALAAVPGQPLLIYQHGGATLSLSGGNVGNVSNRRGAGLFDLNRVARTGGDTIFLALPLRHDYAPAASQVVLAPAAENLTVTTDQSAVQAYDGRLGGVLFLAATGEISLAATLSATGQGFRGGRGVEANSDCDRFTRADDETYPLSSWRGAPRGEGIAGIPSGQESGRAPAGNGGGGGNDHNAGGGGGANVTAGGGGARNIVKGLFNNACRGNFPGRAGRELVAADDRLFFGGGGGAGHANNTDQADGGNGGGLVVLWGRKLTFLPGSGIDVSGQSAAAVNGDGGGGGGAGGSILLLADSLTGSPELNLRGGKGANVNNASDRCFGPGGGGSGGRLLTAAADRTGFVAAPALQPGGAGLRLGSRECSQNEEPAGAGSAGTRRALFTPFLPFAGLSSNGTVFCGGEEVLVTDRSSGATAVSWEVTPASPALSLRPNGNDLAISLADSARGSFTLIQRLELNGAVYPGDTLSFTVAPAASAAGGSISNNEERVTVSVTNGQGFDAIRYDFGDGTVVDTTVLTLQHTYQAGGEYIVKLTLLNARCGNYPVAERTVSVPEFADPKIDRKSIGGCAPYEVTIADRSTGTYSAVRWDFPGAFPSSSNETAPTVRYNDPGDYVITLNLLGAVGPDSTLTIPLTVRATPTAVFNFTQDTSTVVFLASSPTADEFAWEFGDGAVSEEQNPVHTYSDTGRYTVVLVATSDNCTVRIEQEVVIDVLSDVSDLTRLGVKLFPNPTNGTITLTGPAHLVSAFDFTGRMIPTRDSKRLDLSTYPAGMYLVHVRAANKVYTVRIVRR